jgi:uncharacterized protein YjeT (DUF2065 family)
MSEPTPASGLVAETLTAADAGARPAGLLLVAAGIAHLVAPGPLLWAARTGYGTVLGVEFVPGDATTRRVRALGVGMVAAGAHLLYYGGILPE